MGTSLLLAGRAGSALLLPFPDDGFCWECQVSQPSPASPGLPSEVFKLPEPADTFFGKHWFGLFLCCPALPVVHPWRGMYLLLLAPCRALHGLMALERATVPAGQIHSPGSQPCLPGPPGASRCPAVPGIRQGAQELRLWASCSVWPSEGGERAGLRCVCVQEGAGAAGAGRERGAAKEFHV